MHRAIFSLLISAAAAGAAPGVRSDNRTRSDRLRRIIDALGKAEQCVAITVNDPFRK